MAILAEDDISDPVLTKPRQNWEIVTLDFVKVEAAYENAMTVFDGIKDDYTLVA